MCEVTEFFGSKTHGFGDDRKVVAADLEQTLRNDELQWSRSRVKERERSNDRISIVSVS